MRTEDMYYNEQKRQRWEEKTFLLKKIPESRSGWRSPNIKAQRWRFDLFDDYFNPPMAKTAAGDFY